MPKLGGKRTAAGATPAPVTPHDPCSLPALAALRGQGMSITTEAPSANGNTQEQKYLAVEALPDVRVCQLCKSKDSDPDVIYKNRVLLWAYPANPQTRRNTGLQCYICSRVWQARFKAKYGSVTRFLEASRGFGISEQRCPVFSEHRRPVPKLKLFAVHATSSNISNTSAFVFSVRSQPRYFV